MQAGLSLLARRTRRDTVRSGGLFLSGVAHKEGNADCSDNTNVKTV